MQVAALVSGSPLPPAGGPPPSRTQLCRRIAEYQPELLRRARQLVGREQAEDLVQSTFERALAHLDGYQTDTNMLAWLRRIMSNLMIDEWRRQKRRQQACVLLEGAREYPWQGPGGTTPGPAPGLPDSEGESSRRPWEGITAVDVARAIPGLSRQVRPVFVLSQQGLSYQQIGARLGLPTNTVGTRLMRARHQMRKLLVSARSAPALLPANDNHQDQPRAVA